ncbi:hypothetical protein OF829_01940 [Sphingomonas sp. LB-2]|uniref:hypothetical protein n=1 Tax=Sphingomonas caeni TaxID=2984949 RepID=UPI00223081C9|nr:hypothetical protein [Sphingomonas caeni]MCW3845984.1 hypothetical protein [Sphingomonas caeni]
MKQEQSNRPDAALQDGGIAAPEQRSVADNSYEASTERVGRWVADGHDELDRVVVRSWN